MLLHCAEREHSTCAERLPLGLRKRERGCARGYGADRARGCVLRHVDGTVPGDRTRVRTGGQREDSDACHRPRQDMDQRTCPRSSEACAPLWGLGCNAACWLHLTRRPSQHARRIASGSRNARARSRVRRRLLYASPRRAPGPGGSVVGVDLDPAYLAVARREATSYTGAATIELVEAPFDKLPFYDGAFDFAWCAQSLYSLPDPVVVLEHLARVLRPGRTAGFSKTTPCISCSCRGPSASRFLCVTRSCERSLRRPAIRASSESAGACLPCSRPPDWSRCR